MAAHTRRRDSSGHLDPQFQRRTRYEAVLRALALWESFARMPREVQNAFCQTKFPDPILEFDETFPTDPDHRLLRKTLEANFRKAFIVIEGAAVTVRDYFAVIGGLRFTVRDTINQPGFPQECVQFMREAQPRLDQWHDESLPAVWDSLYSAVVVPLVAQSRLDARLLRAAVRREETAGGKYVVRMAVSATEPQMLRVQLDGEPRPMYRVGTGKEWSEVRWLSWGAEQFGRFAPTGSRKEYPVYVQSHALRQLHKRVNLPTMSPYLEYWMYESLRAPHIVEECGGGDLLVEYRIQDHRLGYLVVAPLGDLVAVRTFLFLTMEATPEARLLRERLRLTRRDVDWLGLCDLAAFTQTDLCTDPVLRPLMEACGCGHLFSLREWNFTPQITPQPKAFAAEMRRYLRLAA